MMSCLIFLVFFIFAETTTPTDNVVEKSEQIDMKNQLNKLTQEIEKLNVNLVCSKKTDCQTVALGHRLCGGPQNYIVISQKNKAAQKIKENAKRHTKLSQQYNEKYSGGMVGICSVAIQPEVQCQKNRCVAVPVVE